MVRLLQIIGVAAFVFTGLVLASIKWPMARLHLGVTQDREVASFLEGPRAVSRFNDLKDSQAEDNEGDKTPPLVREAQTLEGIINPRVSPPTEAAPAVAETRITPTFVKPLTPSTAKFDLVGICYSPASPESSFAYIRLPDNSYQWIQLGSEVGHLTVKQIKNGSIICFDGQNLNEMSVEPAVDTASILEVGGVPVASDQGAAGSPSASGRLTGQDESSLSELVHRLKQELQKESRSDQADADAAGGDKAAEVGKLISEYKSSRVSPEEAQKLENLGEQLNGNKSSPAEERRRELIRRMGQPRLPK
ncbi:MAG: hypothetical protein JW955_17760 [Sedimentisphaerales bacterium]|nr:hypothetical protein [Sedimentisphaerales bacterium]